MENELVKWILANQEQIVQVAALIAAVIATLLQRKEKAEHLGVSLMLEAEKLAKGLLIETGPEKMEYVVNNTIDQLPTDVKSYLVLMAKFQGKSLEELTESLTQNWYDLALENIPVA